MNRIALNIDLNVIEKIFVVNFYFFKVNSIHEVPKNIVIEHNLIFFLEDDNLVIKKRVQD